MSIEVPRHVKIVPGGIEETLTGGEGLPGAGLSHLWSSSMCGMPFSNTTLSEFEIESSSLSLGGTCLSHFRPVLLSK